LDEFINTARNSLIAAITIYCNVNQVFGWGEDRSGLCAFMGAIIVAGYNSISYSNNVEDGDEQLIAPTPPRTTIQDATTSDEPAHYSGPGYHLL